MKLLLSVSNTEIQRAESGAYPVPEKRRPFLMGIVLFRYSSLLY